VPSEQQNRESLQQVQEHRDFPRLSVDTKVRVANTATEEAPDHPAEISDLSLGGARLSTPAKLAQGADIGLIPFSGLQDDHPLHRTLQYQVVWLGPEDETSKWREYGLIHTGPVLDVLNSWLGHLLLRQKKEPQLQENRRIPPHRIRFDKTEEQEIFAEVGHQDLRVRLTPLDAAAGGLLARAESDELDIGMHLQLTLGFETPLLEEPIAGCVMDKCNQFGSTYYRIAFDPDSQLEEEFLSLWAQRVGAELTAL